MSNWFRYKTKLNLLIDGILFLALAAMAGIGFLIKWVLVPGFIRNNKYGSDVELEFWGINRHEWGTVHLWVSLSFLILIVLHVILHWKMIGCIFRGMISGKLARIVIAVVIGILALFFSIGPLLINPEVVPVTGNHGHYHLNSREVLPLKAGANKLNYDLKTEEKSDIGNTDKKPGSEKTEAKGQGMFLHEDAFHDLDIAGYMTLTEVANNFKIPVTELAKALNISHEQRGERIGRLKRQYGFSMDELKTIVVKLQAAN